MAWRVDSDNLMHGPAILAAKECRGHGLDWRCSLRAAHVSRSSWGAEEARMAAVRRAEDAMSHGRSTGRRRTHHRGWILPHVKEPEGPFSEFHRLRLLSTRICGSSYRHAARRHL